MSGEISLDINSDARGAVKGIKDVAKALDDVVDELDDAAKESDDTERALVRNFRQIAKASDRMSDDIRSDFKRAGDGAQDFKDEANSSAREAAASFDGSAESISDVFQEISANAFAGFGPAGAVAGLAAAAGIGLAVAGFESIEEERQRSVERINAWADQMIESGSKVLSAAVVNANVAEIVSDTDGEFKKATENAKVWGVSVEDAVLAMAGHGPTLDALRQDLDDQAQAFANTYKEGATLRGEQLQYFKNLQDGRGRLQEYEGSLNAAAGSLDVYTRAVINAAESTEGTVVQVDELGNKLITFPDKTQVVIDADTGQATDDIDEFKGDLASIPKRKATDVDARIRVDDRDLRNYRPPIIYVPGRLQIQGGRQPI